MRRSKSNPARYARNYRSISQRQMTAYDGMDEDEEMERLRQVLRDSKTHLEKATAPSTDGDVDDADSKAKPSRKRTKRAETSEIFIHSMQDSKETVEIESSYENILSKELLDEMGDDQNALLLPPTKKKRPPKKQKIELTSQEVHQAKALQKKTERKLKQLELRKEQKKKRTMLYGKLEETAISKEGTALLSSSSTLGKKMSKREQLKHSLKKERAGLQLTEEEYDLLYKDRGNVDLKSLVENSAVPQTAEVKTLPRDNRTSLSNLTLARKLTREKVENSAEVPQHDHAKDVAFNDVAVEYEDSNEVPASHGPRNFVEVDTVQAKSIVQMSSENKDDKATSTTSFAVQMMASLSRLKKESAVASEKFSKEREREERKRKEETGNIQTTQKRYIPIESAVLKSAASLGIEPTKPENSFLVRAINRPQHIKATRYNLPVAEMEYDVVDAIRTNDVTIICGETGSGKSTQVPQILYEAGFTTAVSDASEKNNFIIGVTQPRRVAAVSTAKRVGYEMGVGNGQTITNGRKGEGNLVAYQTRYEVAGLGPATHVKFMTDGILLQEIQSDLLLRKYSVVILDEAHERNLNTDVLIGLLSVAMPLRHQAAQEAGSGIVPLKLVIMSATLRVEDFVDNVKLFGSNIPAVVKVPGRTYPVTVHHSKVTEIDKYEEAAFRMISKIHKKLPQGGILVFLTGKQEIVRMVKRLRRALNPKNQESRAEAPASTFLEANDVTLSGFSNAVENSTIPRDMDDDEADGDIFRADLSDEYDDSEEFDLNLGSAETKASDSKDAGFEKALVLPLYSLLPAEEQAKIFATVPEGYRLIVVATNVAETSITIPGISYVVDTGRQKCRNYNTSTGVTSFDIMWISKAAADQRAGRAGRTGPGHCYRLYSSSMYARQMDAYALPEVLTRPLEDVVLAMKGMNVSNVGDFPFPTPPDRKQLDAAVRLLADIGCVDLSEIEEKGGDGQATRLGVAVANLPLGVRFGKMLLVAAHAGVLDHAIAMIAALTESSPFVHNGQLSSNGSDEDSDIEINIKDKEDVGAKKRQLWAHKGGDVLAMMLATGAYAFAGHDAGGVSERVACRKFCETNGLHPVIMERIQKMRLHLARLVKTRLPNAQSIATRTGGFLSSMKPPNKLQEDHLKQAIASGLLDNVAMLAPFGYFPGEHTFNLRSAYISCSLNAREPLFMDRNSVLYSRDFRTLPQWVCFESLQRKTLKDGTSVAVMKNLTPVDPIWLGPLAKGSQMIRYGEPLLSPLPTYDVDKDAILCSVLTKYGSHGWEIPPAKMEMFDVLNAPGRKASATFAKEDSFRWFARFLLEGKVFSELKNLPAMLNDSPAVITRRTPLAKVSALVSALAGAGVDSAAALSKHWAEEDDKFLFKILKSWVKAPNTAAAKELWIVTVKTHVMNWKSTHEKRLVVQ